MLAAVALHPNEAPELDGRRHAGRRARRDRPRSPGCRACAPSARPASTSTAPARRAAPPRSRSFEAHIDIAKERGLALQIHDRDAHTEVVDTLLRVGAPDRTVFHCFSGDAGLARLATSHGWYLSFAGTVTFKNAEGLRAALAVAPRSRILVETDAPYLAPVPVRGRPNAPYLVPHTLRAMAAILETDPSMLAAQIASNTEAVYGSWDDEPPVPSAPPRSA